MPKFSLYIKAKFYTKRAFVLLKANFYAYYFRTKYPCESLATLRRNFMPIALINGSISYVTDMRYTVEPP